MMTNVYYRDHFRMLSLPRSVTERSRLRLMPPAAVPQPAPKPRG